MKKKITKKNYVLNFKDLKKNVGIFFFFLALSLQSNTNQIYQSLTQKSTHQLNKCRFELRSEQTKQLKWTNLDLNFFFFFCSDQGSQYRTGGCTSLASSTIYFGYRSIPMYRFGFTAIFLYLSIYICMYVCMYVCVCVCVCVY